MVFSGKGIDEEGQKTGQEEGALHTVGNSGIPDLAIDLMLVLTCDDREGLRVKKKKSTLGGGGWGGLLCQT